MRMYKECRNRNCKKFRIFTDSQSVLKRLENSQNLNFSGQKQIHSIHQKTERLHKRGINAIVQWIPEYSKIIRNEIANNIAKYTAKYDRDINFGYILYTHIKKILKKFELKRMARFIGKNAKRTTLFTEFCKYGQTKVENSKNGTSPKTLIFSNDAIKSRPWFL
jgi:hypothetical protein